MLQSLYITNLAIVDQLEVEFDNGFNVITGETGAGKSIIIGALQLILGGRADKGIIRTGTSRCEISSVFSFKPKTTLFKELTKRLDEIGVALDEGNLIIRRTITASSSRSFLNNTPVPASTLKEIGTLLVAVHGPNDNQTLTQKGVQKQLLDAFGGLQKDIDSCSKTFQELRSIEESIAEHHRNIPNREQVEMLKSQLQEIEDADIRPNEDEEVKERHDLASNAARLLEITQGGRALLTENENCIIDQLSGANRLFTELEQLDEHRGTELKETFYNIIDTIHDFSADLEKYADRVDINPAEYEMMEERLTIISDLKRKYGPTLEDLDTFAASAVDRIDLFENSAEKLKALEERKDDTTADLQIIADLLTEKRTKISGELAVEIEQKLQKLGFKKSRFSIELAKGEIRPDGQDTIDFLFAPNVGEESKSLRKIASSGEISRVMLAVKTVLAKADHTPLLVFDEIDANVGGKVANMVGEELALLGDRHQVFCISHQPQVASCGNIHFVVAKEVIEDRTRTNILRLSQDERVTEIARMLGGDHSKPEVIEHARSMIQS